MRRTFLSLKTKFLLRSLWVSGLSLCHSFFLFLKNTPSQACLKSFLECHGLSLLWIWMAELGDSRGNTANNLKIQLEVSRCHILVCIFSKMALGQRKPDLLLFRVDDQRPILLENDNGESKEFVSLVLFCTKSNQSIHLHMLAPG